MIFIFIKINNNLSEEGVHIKHTLFDKTYSWENESKYSKYSKYSKFRKTSFITDRENCTISNESFY